MYKFGQFSLDPDVSALYFRDVLVKDLPKKQIQVLAYLVSQAGRLVSHEDIIHRIWGENVHGVTPARINQSVSRINNALIRFDPTAKYFENVRGVGYIFLQPVVEEEKIAAIPGPSLQSKKRIVQYVFGILGLSTVLAVVAWTLWPPSSNDTDEAEIRALVFEARSYETLVIYENPSSLNEIRLDLFWTTDSFDRGSIRSNASQLVRDGDYYGRESKNERFEFQTIEISSDGKYAVVRTLEKWFIAEYNKNGTLPQFKTEGPYFVTYTLRKINERWLIDKSTRGRSS